MARFIIAIFGLCLGVVVAMAQVITDEAEGLFDSFTTRIPTLDENGVNLGRGSLMLQTPGVSVGSEGQGELRFFRLYNGTSSSTSRYVSRWSHNLAGGLSELQIGVYPENMEKKDWFPSIRSLSTRFVFVAAPMAGQATFLRDGDTFTEMPPKVGATLTKSGATYEFISSNGTMATFDEGIRSRTNDNSNGLSGTYGPLEVNLAAIKKITKPNGEIVNFDYAVDDQGALDYWRLQSVWNNYGKAIHLEYVNNSNGNEFSWHTIKKATAYDWTLEPGCGHLATACSSMAQSWPSESYTGTYHVLRSATDGLGRQIQYGVYNHDDCDMGQGVKSLVRPDVLLKYEGRACMPTSVTFPGSATANVEFEYQEGERFTQQVVGGQFPEKYDIGALLTKVKKGTRIWSYSYDAPTRDRLPAQMDVVIDRTTVTTPDQSERIYDFERFENRYERICLYGGLCGPHAYVDFGLMLDPILVRKEDENGNVTTYGYNAPPYPYPPAILENGSVNPDMQTQFGFDLDARVREIAFPEGNKETFVYDERGNLELATRIAKPGSGLSSISSEAGYAASCTAPTRKTCNQPQWFRNARSHQTSFSYDDAHGGLTSVRQPSVEGSVPEARYFYESKASADSTGVYKRTGEASCMSSNFSGTYQASATHGSNNCTAGPADKIRTQWQYGTIGGGRLLPTQITRSDGSGTLASVVNTAYTHAGDADIVDGPVANDDRRFVYDLMRRPIGDIGPDPDGAGPLPPTASRTRYHPYGGVEWEERGTVANQSAQTMANFARTDTGSSFTALERTRTHYYQLTGERSGQRIHDGAGAATKRLIRYGYDVAGRLQCTALRMNPAALDAAIPLDDSGAACTPQTEGELGPDRIEKKLYDDAGHVIEIRQAVGTPDERPYARYGYSANGVKTSELDANNNLTVLEYDGFDRLKKVRYPEAGLGVNRASVTDYEEFSRDPAGNVLTHRRRDGQVIGFEYDELNRERLRDYPAGAAVQDIHTRYDLAGRVLKKRFGSVNGSGVSYTHDALGRLTATTDMNGRTVGYQYNPAGARTQLSFPEASQALAYGLDSLGRITGISHLAGGVTTSLLTQGYDGLGRRNSLARGGAGSTSYSYDGASRLETLGHDMSGSTYDVTWTFQYSPASEVVGVEASRPDYDYKAQTLAAVSKNYDGLNRDAGLAAVSGGYDVRGNLTKNGTRSFTYDIDNRLLTAAGGSAALVLEYDPEGRLSKQTAGATVTTFLYDGADLIGEYDGSGNVLRRYVHGSGVDEPLVWFEGAGASQRRYFYQDRLGSVIGWSDVSGVLQELYKYGPYGEPQNATHVESWTGSRFRYTGQTALPEAKLYHYKARAYDPVMGRFLQTDPIGSKSDLNLYVYALNSPTGYVDPDGRSPIDIAFLVYDIGKLGVAIYSGAGVGAAALDVASSAAGVVSPVPGTGQAIKAARAADKAVDIGRGAANGTTPLFRAVGPSELADIRATDQLRNLGSAEGKYFTSSAEEASAYAKQAVKAFRDEPYTIIRTDVPDSILRGLSPVTVDRGIPAWVIPTNNLPGLTPNVMNYSPLPPLRF